MSSYHISFDWSGVVSEEIVRATAGIEDAASLCLLNSVHVGRTCWEAHGLDFRQINQYDPDSQRAVSPVIPTLSETCCE